MKTSPISDRFAEAIKTLMHSRPLERISVSEIVRAAGLSRTTFYHHFADKHELIEYVFINELADPLFWDIDQQFLEHEILFLQGLLKERAFYLNALSLLGQNSFYDIWLSLVRKSMRAYLAGQLGEGHPDLDLYTGFLAYAWVNSNIQWLRNPVLSPEDMASRLYALMRRGVDGVTPTATPGQAPDSGSQPS